MDYEKAAYDEGLAEGHYQADSMYAKCVRNQNKMRDDKGAAVTDKYPSKPTAAKSAGKAYGGKAGLGR